MLPAKPSVTTTSTLPLPMSSPSTKSYIIEIGQLLLTQNAARFADRFQAFDFFDADIEQTHGRPRNAEQDARGRGSHHGEIDQVFGIRADRGADVEHDQFAAQGRPQRRDRGPVDPRQHLELELRHRHQRAGIARRYRHIGFALLDRLDRQPHRRFPAAIAQRLARLVFHAHRDVGVDEARGGLERRARGQERRHQRGVAEKSKFAFGMTGQSEFSAGNNDSGAMVSPHRVESNADLLRHWLTLRVLCPQDEGGRTAPTITFRSAETTAISLHGRPS